MALGTTFELVHVLIFMVAMAILSPAAFVQGEENVGAQRTEISVTSDAATKAGAFALEELQKLSDSGIYKTLRLKSITSAAVQEGVFHSNTFLDVVLSSPHLENEERESRHEIMVMKSLDDGVYSFAIDEFPQMQEEAIQKYWEQMVEDHKANREKVFAEMEKDYLENGLPSGKNAEEVKQSLAGKKTAELRQMLRESSTSPEHKIVIRKLLDERWKELEKREAQAKTEL